METQQERPKCAVGIHANSLRLGWQIRNYLAPKCAYLYPLFLGCDQPPAGAIGDGKFLRRRSQCCKPRCDRCGSDATIRADPPDDRVEDRVSFSDTVQSD